MEQTRYQPMLLAPTDKLPVGEEWAYEPKLNGWRMMAYESPKRWSLITRGGFDYTTNFAEIAKQLPVALNGSQAVLDGEVVALDRQRREHRELLLRPLAASIIFYAFDIIEFDDVALVHEPWRNRRQLLKEVVNNQPNVIVVDAYEHTDLEDLMKAARRKGMEGIVAKRKDSPYQSNSRSKDYWLKYRFPPPSRRSTKATTSRSR